MGLLPLGCTVVGCLLVLACLVLGRVVGLLPVGRFFSVISVILFLTGLIW